MTLKIQEDVRLAPLTTLKVGGAARFFADAETEAEIAEAVSYARENDLPVFVLGGGSNVLISDAGFDGLVLKISNRGISVRRDAANVFITPQAGEDWDEFVKFTIKQNSQGVECLSGIPGTVGGTPVQNVGAYGQEVSETIQSVRVLERGSGKIFEMTNEDCRFAYRTSVFNTNRKNEFIVTAATFRLKSGGAPKIVYRDLQSYFGERVPDLQETRDAVLEIRRRKSMVIDANDPNSKSAGSFFKNPVVSKEEHARIVETAKSFGIENVPNFTADENNIKIPAAWLIENSGFYKGYTKGSAGISTRHTLALVNRGSAAAREICVLKNEIQLKVKEKFGVELKPEPVFVGNF